MMYWPRRLKRWAGSLIAPAVGVTLTLYFADHIVIGDRGLAAWRRLAVEIHAQDARLTALQTEHKTLERKVYGLSPEHLDRDLLDERVRASLNLVAPNEIVIMRQPPAASR
jgi:cell division protein FtsB